MPLPDLRHSIRSLLRARSLTTVSILTVALGVGAGTSLFSVVKAVLLNPLPYPHADRIAWVSEVGESGLPRPVAYANFRDWVAGNRSFTALAAFSYDIVNISGDPPQRVVVGEVTDGFFEAMGAQPMLGRAFLPAEQVQGAPLTALIGYGLWQRLYGGDRSVLGRTIRLSGRGVTVIGIMPPGFDYPDKAEAWVSITAVGDVVESRTAHNHRAVGRLRPGVSFEQARADLGGQMQRLYRQEPGPFMSKDAAVVPLAAHTVGKVRPALLMLFGAVGFLLLIVCVNVANLLLARVTARARELAVRRALGAGRPQLFRQMLTESLLLSLGGGALGLAIALYSMEVLKILLPADMPRTGEIRIDGGVIAFALAVSTAAGVLFGLLPAWRASRMNLNEAIKAGSVRYTAGRSSHRVQSALVISEVALSLVLLAGAGLLINSFVRLGAVDPGFRTDHVLTAELSFSSGGDESDIPRLRAEYTDLLRRVRAVPGVADAGTINEFPLDGGSDGSFRVENRMLPDSADAVYAVVSPGYLRAMRIPLQSGRDFTDADSANGGGVAILSAEMARQYWPGRNPLGDRIWFNSMERNEHWLTVVGVAADVHQYGLTERPFPQAYVCYTQAQRLASGTLAIYTPLPPASLESAVRQAVRAVDPETTVTFRTIGAVLAASIARQRFQMQILGGFAALALFLAAVGLYGVLSYMVTGRRGEIGIRMALGAQPGGVFRMIAARALGLAATGACIGLAGCLAVRHVLAALLFGVGASDPATLAAAMGVLLAVALAAAGFPALRAMRVDPVSVLREE